MRHVIPTFAWIIQPINWPDDPERPQVRQQPPDDAMTDFDDHPVYTSGSRRATPGCPCERCRAVFDEWAEQARGFQRWLDELTPVEHDRWFGPNGVATLRYV
jgi:hypothetical protein